LRWRCAAHGISRLVVGDDHFYLQFIQFDGLQSRLYADVLDKHWSDATRGSRCKCGEDKVMGKNA